MQKILHNIFLVDVLAISLASDTSFLLRLRYHIIELIHLVQNIQSYIKVASIETLVFSRTDILYDY